MQSNNSNLGYPETVHKLMKIYIVQYLIKHNYQKVHENGLNILADLLIKYIQKLGQKTKQIAEKSKRNIPNMLQLFMVMDQTNVNLMRLNDFILDEEHGTADDGFMQSVCKEVFPEHEIEQFRKNQLSKQDLEGLQMSFIEKQNQEPIILMPTLDQMIQPPDQNSLKKTNMQQKQYLNEIEIKNLKIKQKEYFQNQQQEIIQKKQELIEQELENQRKVNQALGIGGEFSKPNKFQTTMLKKRKALEQDKNNLIQEYESKYLIKKQINENQDHSISQNPFNVQSKYVERINISNQKGEEIFK